MSALRTRLASWTGVWEGSYDHLSADGERLDRHRSRQETRLVGDRWYERVIYRWEDREETLDFRAHLEGEELRFEDPNFEGRATLVDDRVLVFPYRWKNRPGLEIVETIVFPAPGRRCRLWQSFEGGELARVTVIREQRVEGVPEVWE